MEVRNEFVSELNRDEDGKLAIAYCVESGRDALISQDWNGFRIQPTTGQFKNAVEMETALDQLILGNCVAEAFSVASDASCLNLTEKPWPPLSNMCGCFFMACRAILPIRMPETPR